MAVGVSGRDSLFVVGLRLGLLAGTSGVWQFSKAADRFHKTGKVFHPILAAIAAVPVLSPCLAKRCAKCVFPFRPVPHTNMEEPPRLAFML